MPRSIPSIVSINYFLFLFIFFSGCSTTARYQYHVIPKNYLRGYEERGIASWYGPNFHGKRTANGEIYNMYSYTAAHKILPFNTKVLVTNLYNHKKVVVRINDRGPFVKNRIIDLSYVAAKKLGMIGTGTAPVLIKVINTPHYSHQTFFIQVGSFLNKINGYKVYFSLFKMGYKQSFIQKIKKQNHTFWRVLAGEFNDISSARYALKRLILKFPQAFIVAR